MADFNNALVQLNQQIYDEVPKIEQERLFYITMILYYVINEVYDLKMRGQMLITPKTNFQIAMIKTRTEGSGGDGGGGF